jgi:TolA-binding protein
VPPVSLEPQFALALVVALVSAVGAFFAVKFGGAETQRLVKALHGRFDHLEGEVASVKLQQARQDERIKGLKESQRFRLQTKRALAEAQNAGEVPMFIVDEDDEV